MNEGDTVFKEAINFLKSLAPLHPLEWSESLAESAMEHVNDIGPKGLLSYQSSDGTEPEDRIAKYGNYTESLGENIDFGPNDALGVIISMTLDDGEENRPHRENLFKNDYYKVGIACGSHQSEFQMCVMDFAYDFSPLKKNTNKSNKHYGLPKQQNVSSLQDKMGSNEVKIAMNKEDMLNNSNFAKNNMNSIGMMNNQSPLVKLSLEPEEIKMNKNNAVNNVNSRIPQQQGSGVVSEVEEVTERMKNIMQSLKVVEKKVEIVTKIIYVYEDGSNREVSETQNHVFKY